MAAKKKKAPSKPKGQRAREIFAAPLRVTRALRKVVPYEAAQERAAIEALENAAADLTDVLVLAPLAKLAAIDWIKLYPEAKGKRAQGKRLTSHPRRGASYADTDEGRARKLDPSFAREHTRAMRPTETAPQRRRRLRADARERQRETVPKLKTAIRELRAAKLRRRRECVASCKRRRAKITSEAKRAREALRARVAKLRIKARETCAACKQSVRDSDLDELDRLLAHLAEERKVIGVLRGQARGLTSERGRAGGRRAAELRAEALDQVKRDVGDDPILAALWERERTRIKKRPRASLTESFLEWVAEHPEAIEEMQTAQERAYDAEAEAMLGTLRAPRAADDTDRWLKDLDAADRWLLKDAPKGLAAPF